MRRSYAAKKFRGPGRWQEGWIRPATVRTTKLENCRCDSTGGVQILRIYRKRFGGTLARRSFRQLRDDSAMGKPAF